MQQKIQELEVSKQQKLAETTGRRARALSRNTKTKIASREFAAHSIWQKSLEPPLPYNILEILESPCPIWGERYPEKKVIVTHLLTLIFHKGRWEVLTLNCLKELISRPKAGGNKVEYEEGGYEYSDVSYMFGDLPSKFANGASHWVLMTKDVVPGTRGKFYQEQGE